MLPQCYGSQGAFNLLGMDVAKSGQIKTRMGSATEAELTALKLALPVMLFARELLIEIVILEVKDKIHVYEDNTAVIALLKNGESNYYLDTKYTHISCELLYYLSAY